MTRPLWRLTVITLTLLAVAGLLLQQGSVPHGHGGGHEGVYNQEHDLTLLASHAAQANTADPPAPVVVEVVSAPLVPATPLRHPLRHPRRAQTRAPPAA